MTTSGISRFAAFACRVFPGSTDARAPTGAALRGAEDGTGPAGGERARAERAVTEDTAEVLARPVEAFALVGEVPGVELPRVSWSGERIDRGPDSPEGGAGDEDESLFDAGYEDRDDESGGEEPLRDASCGGGSRAHGTTWGNVDPARQPAHRIGTSQTAQRPAFPRSAPADVASPTRVGLGNRITRS
ncbi:hypothetical protein [Streptomyces sp. NPDC093991]|uniref:hypothetical protein n=1 Tax=unclassified Streptomyces TaxID=2593676 RepID=UPI0034166132